MSLRALVIGLVAAVSARAASAETIKEIVVVENSKTTEDTVRFIANIDDGDDWDTTTQDRVRIDLVSSGLFKDVSVYSEPHPQGGGVKVTIIAKDKHSWVIAPTIYNQPTNKGAGVGFGENNLFGENKKLLLYAQLATGDSFFVGAYVDPSIAGTIFHWQLDVFLQNERIIEYAPPSELLESPKEVRESKLRYLNGGLKLGVTLFRSFTIDGRLRSAYVFYEDTPSLAEGAVEEDLGLMPGDPIPKPGAEGWDTSAEAIVKFDRRANWYGITSGDKYQVSYEKALPGLGSEFDYWYASASYERARKYFSRHNLILKAMVGYGEDVPFQHERTSGGTSLRGYKNAQFRGDFKSGANIEYSVPVLSISGFALRALGFIDATYTTFLDTADNAMDGTRHYLPESEAAGLAPLKSSVGVGTRVYLRQIVLPLLGLDVGYGLEGGGLELYFAIGITDF
jgi:outer membrane protein assembly factor BamA